MDTEVQKRKTTRFGKMKIQAEIEISSDFEIDTEGKALDSVYDENGEDEIVDATHTLYINKTKVAEWRVTTWQTGYCVRDRNYPENLLAALCLKDIEDTFVCSIGDNDETEGEE